MFMEWGWPISEALLNGGGLKQLFFCKTNLVRIIRLFLTIYNPNLLNCLNSKQQLTFISEIIRLTQTSGSYTYIRQLFEPLDFNKLGLELPDCAIVILDKSVYINQPNQLCRLEETCQSIKQNNVLYSLKVNQNVTSSNTNHLDIAFINTLKSEYRKELEDKTIFLQQEIANISNFTNLFFNKTKLDTYLNNKQLIIVGSKNLEAQNTEQNSLNTTEFNESKKQYIKDMESFLKQSVIDYDKTSYLQDKNYMLTPFMASIINDLMSFAKESGHKFKLFNIKKENGAKQVLEFLDKNLNQITSAKQVIEALKGDKLEVIEFVQNCIFNPIPHNLRQVKLSVYEKKIEVFCFHDTCQSEKKYDSLKDALRSLYITNILLKLPGPFRKSSSSIKDILSNKSKSNNNNIVDTKLDKI